MDKQNETQVKDTNREGCRNQSTKQSIERQTDRIKIRVTEKGKRMNEQKEAFKFETQLAVHRGQRTNQPSRDRGFESRPRFEKDKGQ